MAEQDELTQDKKAKPVADRSGSAEPSLASLRRKLDEQSRRIAALALGREESMKLIDELRAELALVASDRDKLRKTLTDLEGMQTETVTLGDGDVADFVDTGVGETPSIDELMSTFSGADTGRLASHSTIQIENDGDDSGEYQEMISPEAIVLGAHHQKAVRAASERYLVLTAASGNTKCPLDQELLTIGRSDSADIQIDGDFVSRIHARILRIGMDSVIEDAGSKNGTRVNGELVQRHVLKHGDLLRVGSVSFRYVDTATGADSD